MAIETFTWSPRINASGDITYRVRKTQFGDGYAQVSGDGPNPRNQRYELTFIGNEARIRNIRDFLDRHQGWKSFAWKPPLEDLGLYRCESHKPTAMGAGNYSLSATFIEAFHP